MSGFNPAAFSQVNPSALGSFNRFGRPTSLPGAAPQSPVAQSGQYSPHQSLVNNLWMLGKQNPIPALGYGTYRAPAPVPQQQAPAAAAPAPVATDPNNTNYVSPFPGVGSYN